MDREMESMIEIAEGLSRSKRLKNASLVFSAGGITAFGAPDSFLKGSRFEVKWNPSQTEMVTVTLGLSPDLSEESIEKAARECEVEYHGRAAVSLTVRATAKCVEDALFLLDQAAVIASLHEASIRANACCEEFDLISLARERGFEVEPDFEWHYELDDDEKALPRMRYLTISPYSRRHFI